MLNSSCNTCHGWLDLSELWHLTSLYPLKLCITTFHQRRGLFGKRQVYHSDWRPAVIDEEWFVCLFFAGPDLWVSGFFIMRRILLNYTGQSLFHIARHSRDLLNDLTAHVHDFGLTDLQGDWFIRPVFDATTDISEFSPLQLPEKN